MNIEIRTLDNSVLKKGETVFFKQNNKIINGIIMDFLQKDDIIIVKIVSMWYGPFEFSLNELETIAYKNKQNLIAWCGKEYSW